MLDPIVAPIELRIDVDARRARVSIPGLVEAEGTPITDPFSGGEHRVAIELPNGFEFTRTEVGRGSTHVSAGIQLELSGSHAHAAPLHMNQDGVIR